MVGKCTWLRILKRWTPVLSALDFWGLYEKKIIICFDTFMMILKKYEICWIVAVCKLDRNFSVVLQRNEENHTVKLSSFHFCTENESSQSFATLEVPWQQFIHRNTGKNGSFWHYWEREEGKRRREDME
jgi:hypothetical protein